MHSMDSGDARPTKRVIVNKARNCECMNINFEAGSGEMSVNNQNDCIYILTEGWTFTLTCHTHVK